MKNKAQSSLEFLMIFGIGFTIILVMGGIFFGYFNSEKDTLDRKHIIKVSEELINNIEQIYFLGEGNKVTMKTKFPSLIENLTIHHVNITDPNNPGERLYYDYLNFSYYDEDDYYSLLFEANELYIRFNCTRCDNTSIVDGEWVSYYNDTSDFAGGPKRINIESKGDWVSIDFDK